MNSGLYNHIARLKALPKWLRWIERCDPSVLEAYRSAQRLVFARRLPLGAGIVVVAAALKATGAFPIGHPAIFAFFACATATFIWPSSFFNLGRAAWRAAPASAAFHRRLRVLAVVLGLQVMLSVILIIVLVGLALALVIGRP